jgi:hypothetical protein
LRTLTHRKLRHSHARLGHAQPSPSLKPILRRCWPSAPKKRHAKHRNDYKLSSHSLYRGVRRLAAAFTMLPAPQSFSSSAMMEPFSAPSAFTS